MIQSTLQREIPHLRREGSALNNTKSSETASNTDNARNPTTQNLPRWFRRKTFSPETVASESLEDQANILSQWFLTFLTPLLKVGSRQTLEDADVGVPSRGDRAAYVYETIRKEWVREIQVTNEKNTERRRVYISKRAACQSEIKALEMEPFKDLEPSLRGPLLRAFGRYRIVLAFIYYSLSVLLGFVPIIVLSRLVRWLEDEKPIDEYSGISSSPWIDSAVIGTVAYISSSLLKTRHHVIMTHCSIFVRTGVSMLLYRKGLRISAAARQKMSTGQVVNLMSNDAVQLQRYLKFGGMTIVAPIEIIIAFFLVFQQVSYPCERYILLFLSNIEIVKGRECCLGRCGLYGTLITHQFKPTRRCFDTTQTSYSILGFTSQTHERNHCRNSRDQILCMGATIRDSD